MVIRRVMLKQCIKRQQCQQRFLNSGGTSGKSPAEYCLNLVRNHDYENYLCTLLLPNNIRSAGFAIRAFNVEVAMVEDRIKDKQIGLMRMKFWNNVIENVFSDKPAKTPVALELHRVLKKHKLSKEHFKKLIDARDYKLTSSKFLNLDSIEKYAERSVSPVYYLLLESNNVDDNSIKLFASHVGKTQGIMTLIRSVPYNSQRQTLVLPEDLLQKHKLTAKLVFKSQNVKELQNVIEEIAEKAKEHIDEAMKMKSYIKGDNKLIFMPFYVAKQYLSRLRKLDWNIYHQSLIRRNNLLPLQLLFRKLINKPF